LGVAADFDNDGWRDIYIACDMMPSLYFHNMYDGTFEKSAARKPVWRSILMAHFRLAWGGGCRLRWRRPS